MSSGTSPPGLFASMVQTAALAIQRAPAGLTPAQLEELASRKVVGLWGRLAQAELPRILSAASLAVFGAEALNAGDWARYEAAATALSSPGTGNVFVTARATFSQPLQTPFSNRQPSRFRTIQVEVPSFMAGELVAEVIKRVKDQWEGESGGGEIEVEILTVVGG